MVYNNQIPQANNNLSVSQVDILGNFQSVDSGTTSSGIGFSRNHVTMTDATNGGLHFRVDFYQPTSSPTIMGFVSSLYPQTVSAIPELFYKNGTRDTQMTLSSFVAASGQAFIPGGLQIRCGGGSTGTPVVFSPAFPNKFRSVLVSAAANGEQINVTVPTELGFTPERGGGGGSVNIWYVAFGY